MTDVYKTSKYPNSVNDCGCGYANKIMEELENTEELEHSENLYQKITELNHYLMKACRT